MSSLAKKLPKYVSHNSFDLVWKGNRFVATSHNFPECVGEARKKEDAIDLMDRKIIYLKDNEPKRYIKNLRDRIENGLECGCGKTLDGQIMGVIGTPNLRRNNGRRK